MELYWFNGTGDGRVFLYDFGRDRQQPVQVLDVCGASAPVYALAFNQQAPELFATADQRGVKVSYHVHIGFDPT